MDVREKLVELLTNSPQLDVLDWTTGWEEAANYLIANGVTVQECAEISDEFLKQLKNAPITILQEEPTIEVVQWWISVKDRLPEEEGLYLVAVVNDHERRYSKTAWYHGHGNWFLHQKVTHWQYLPQPPKGE